MFAGSLLLVVAASIPMVVFFNLFADPNAKRSKKVPLMDQEESHDMFKDSFNYFSRNKDD